MRNPLKSGLAPGLEEGGQFQAAPSRTPYSRNVLQHKGVAQVVPSKHAMQIHWGVEPVFLKHSPRMKMI